ncbi:MAG TPA: thioesterase family protein, partial [Candidatus Omnitrophota bacterium]|nr:thioesterase family protein [Candidatus Omnitrophota bacterium]
AHQDIDYKSPAFYADVLSIETKVPKVSSASFVFEYTVTNKKTAQLIAAGKTVMVCVNKDIQPQKLPQEIRDKLLA